MTKKEQEKEKKERTMFSIKYVGDRKEKIAKLMKKYNKLTIASLFDELLLLGELNNDSVYMLSESEKDDSLEKIIDTMTDSLFDEIDSLKNEVKEVKEDIKEIKNFLLELNQKEKEQKIALKKKEKISFDESEEDF